jgi:hypothetical protein
MGVSAFQGWPLGWLLRRMAQANDADVAPGPPEIGGPPVVDPEPDTGGRSVARVPGRKPSPFRPPAKRDGRPRKWL